MLSSPPASKMSRISRYAAMALSSCLFCSKSAAFFLSVATLAIVPKATPCALAVTSVPAHPGTTAPLISVPIGELADVADVEEGEIGRKTGAQLARFGGQPESRGAIRGGRHQGLRDR